MAALVVRSHVPAPCSRAGNGPPGAVGRCDRIALPNENHHYEGAGLATALAASVGYLVRQLGERPP